MSYTKKKMWKDLFSLKEPALAHQIPSSLLKNSLYEDSSIACTPTKCSRFFIIPQLQTTSQVNQTK